VGVSLTLKDSWNKCKKELPV